MSGQSQHTRSRNHTLALALATPSLVALAAFLAPTTPATADTWQLGAHEPSGSATLYRDCPAGKQVGASSTIAATGSTLHAYVSGSQTYTRAFSGRISLSISPFNYATVNFSSNRDLTSVQTACG